MKKQLTNMLEKDTAIELAILFGSQSRGNSTVNSDIDLAILRQEALTSAYKTQLISELALTFGRPVDLIDLRSVGEPLLGEILQGECLFDHDHHFPRLLTQHLIDAADFLPLQDRILKTRREQWING